LAFLLIADDNPLSLHFLADAAASAGWQVCAVADGVDALARGQEHRFDLLLLDLAMPGLGGIEVVANLRADIRAASRHCPALATSADLSAEQRRWLRQHGFAGVVGKPIALEALRKLLAAYRDGHIGEVREAPAPSYRSGGALLDDDAAMIACGDRTVVKGLRQIFLGELATFAAELDVLSKLDSPLALRDRLHRLRSSCGFCGAARLDEVCRNMLERDAPAGLRDLEKLLDIATATRQLLERRF
jgi:two-component system OmpR family response regulator